MVTLEFFGGAVRLRGDPVRPKDKYGVPPPKQRTVKLSAASVGMTDVLADGRMTDVFGDGWADECVRHGWAERNVGVGRGGAGMLGRKVAWGS